MAIFSVSVKRENRFLTTKCARVCLLSVNVCIRFKWTAPPQRISKALFFSTSLYCIASNPNYCLWCAQSIRSKAHVAILVAAWTLMCTRAWCGIKHTHTQTNVISFPAHFARTLRLMITIFVLKLRFFLWKHVCRSRHSKLESYIASRIPDTTNVAAILLWWPRWIDSYAFMFVCVCVFLCERAIIPMSPRESDEWNSFRLLFPSSLVDLTKLAA